MEKSVQRLIQSGRDPFKPMVPAGVRFLVATVDVQRNMFVVQVFGILPGAPFDMALIDRFHIVKSHRVDDAGEHLWVKPPTYLEDWDRITEEVINRTYPLADGSGRRMMIKLTGCDSGGKEGTTTNAYNYYRGLRQQGLHGRFHLIIGNSTPGAPRTNITYPDSNRRDKFAAARGDVPVLMLHSNELKDILASRLDCVVPGKGMLRTADWLPDFVYSELCVETRTTKGWENPNSYRNESWDLSYYAIGLCISKLIGIEHIDWDNPPLWAADWDKNVLISASADNKRFTAQQKEVYDFGNLAASLA